MASPYWHADTSRYPLIVVHLVDADGVQQPDVNSLIHIVEGFIEKRERIVVVYDLTHSKPDTKRRQLLVSWLSENISMLSRYVVASALVAPTPFHRGLLVTTFWVVSLRRPRRGDRVGDRPGAACRLERIAEIDEGTASSGCRDCAGCHFIGRDRARARRPGAAGPVR